jgi:serine protease inhibitor ecotin
MTSHQDCEDRKFGEITESGVVVGAVFDWSALVDMESPTSNIIACFEGLNHMTLIRRC